MNGTGGSALFYSAAKLCAPWTLVLGLLTAAMVAGKGYE